MDRTTRTIRSAYHLAAASLAAYEQLYDSDPSPELARIVAAHRRNMARIAQAAQTIAAARR